MKMKYLSILILILLNASRGWGAPEELTYQGRILKADGTPLEYGSVSFLFEITSADGSCTIYREQRNGVNMTGSGGIFDVSIGSGTKLYPSDPAFKISDAFNNSTSFTCDGSANYTPTLTDKRILKVQFYDGTGWKVVSPNTDIRSVPFAHYAMSAQKLGTNLASDFILKNEVNNPGSGSVSCDSGSFLTWDALGQKFGCATVSGGAGGTVTSVSSANSYLSVLNGSSAPVLTLNVGVAANTVAAGNDTRIVNAIQSGASAGGDLAGTYPNPSVAKILNTGLSFSSLTSGQYLKYNGTNWVNSNISQSDVTGLTTTLSGYMTTSAFSSDVASAACSSSQSMYWNSVSQAFACQNISVSNFSGSLAGDVSGAQGATSVDKIKGVVVSTTAPTNGQVLKYNSSTTQWEPSVDSNAGGTITALTSDVSASGSGSVAATVNLVGGSTAANIHSAEVLANAATNANAANTIVKRDASGNFSAGIITANLTGDVTGASSLNVLKTGDTMSGNLTFSSNSKGTVYTDSGSNTATIEGPSSAISSSYVMRLPTAQGSANQVLTNDGSGNLFWNSPSATATAYSGVLPIANGGTNSSAALTNGKIMVSSGGAIVEGVATSSLQTTTLSDGKILVGNSSNVATAVTPSSDVSMADTGAFTVAKIQGTSVSATAPTTSGQVLRYNGTSWIPNFVSMADLRSTITGASALTSCTSGQTLTWSAATDNLACSNISIAAANFSSQTANTFLAAPNGSAGTPTFRTIASADLPSGGYDTTYFKNGGNSFGGPATLGTNDSNALGLNTAGATRMTIDTSGNVGVGTTSPAAKLEVQGQVVSKSYDNGSGSSFNFNNGNVQYTSASCGALTLSNMVDGGTYTIAINGTTAGTCTFTHTGLTFVSNFSGSTMSGTKSLFNFQRVGTTVFVSWSSGYQ